MMNVALMTTMMMMNNTRRHSTTTMARSHKATEVQAEPKTHVLYEVKSGKVGKKLLATYKARKAAENAAVRLNGHVVVRFVTLTEYKATESSAKK